MDGEAHLKLLKAHSLDSQLTQKLEKIQSTKTMDHIYLKYQLTC
jgi:hypothetical protein